MAAQHLIILYKALVTESNDVQGMRISAVAEYCKDFSGKKPGKQTLPGAGSDAGLKDVVPCQADKGGKGPFLYARQDGSSAECRHGYFQAAR